MKKKDLLLYCPESSDLIASRKHWIQFNDATQMHFVKRIFPKKVGCTRRHLFMVGILTNVSFRGYDLKPNAFDVL